MSKCNLVKKGISVENSVCNMCGEGEETTSHIFCTCKVVYLVWFKCYEWVDLALIVHQETKMHFSQFRMVEESEVVNRIWLCMWITIIGELWKQRNKKIFRNGHIDHMEIFSRTQLKVWSWVTSNVCLSRFSYSNWCLKPLVCIRSIKKCRFLHLVVFV